MHLGSGSPKEFSLLIKTGPRYYTHSVVETMVRPQEVTGSITPLAPEPILRAALYVVHVAAYTTRNWTYADGWRQQQVYDLWEALHEVPSLVTRWRPDAERELLMYLDEYDRKWPTPRLREMYQGHLEHGGPA